ncbi:hypothetical protein, partial [Bacillus sp. JJ1562]|uniref:hypothetical protein n=1 Tax=Bacillus sp. JJ1562 TaxID=3122960 RepID=UPI003002A552
MGKRTRIMNKTVAILMVFLLIATAFIQSVSAIESNTTVESSESTEVEEGKANVEGSEPASAITTSPNVLGNLMKNGNPLSGINLSIYNSTIDSWYNAVTETNGDFGFAVPDGEYELLGVWVDSESKWYPHVVSFTVQGGKVNNPDLLHIDLSEKASNVAGSVV